MTPEELKEARVMAKVMRDIANQFPVATTIDRLCDEVERLQRRVEVDKAQKSVVDLYRLNGSVPRED